jgi:dihydrofolate synthase/folylpolyglutamate synthase
MRRCKALCFSQGAKEERATNYPAAIAYLQSLLRFGIVPGLERTEELLRRLGNPHQAAYPIFHITGTNGKGSVSAMVEAVLRAAGYKTGLYTSPALEHFRERIQVNREPIAEADVARLVPRVKAAVEAMVADGFEQPTEFEVTTALAFLHYAEAGIDALVLEVGLGGRYDATNVVPRPLVTAVTNVTLDHTKILGHTVEQIAWDKAGIIKPGVPCVTAAADEAQRVLQQVADEMGAPLLDARPTVQAHVRALTGQRVDLQVGDFAWTGLELGLLGDHQVQNAAVALGILMTARMQGLALSNDAIRTGLRTAHWPGRFEVIGPHATLPVVLDSAHNPAGMAALASALEQYFPGRRAVAVLGMLADKEATEALAQLVPHLRAVVATTPQSPRALAAEALAGLLPPGLVAAVEPNLQAALAQARGLVQPGDLLLVSGSTYVVGPLRQAALTLAG